MKVSFLAPVTEAANRGQEKIRAEIERKEAERQAREEERRARWFDLFDQAQRALPEIVRPYLIDDFDCAWLPTHISQHFWELRIIDYAPIFVDFDENGDVERFIVAEVDYIESNGEVKWRRNQLKSNVIDDIEIALAMARQSYQDAQRRALPYIAYSQATEERPEPTYIPVDDDPIIVNPLLGELTDYIRGIVDERLDERGH